MAAAGSEKRLVVREAALLERPPTAWPTVALFAGALAAFAWGLAALASEEGPGLLSGATMAVSIFVLFTPMHDAAHVAVSPAHKWLNELVGRVCALSFFAPFPAFRYVHLMHHKHTNDPKLDPDFFAGSHPVVLLPLRWAAMDYHYYGEYLRVLRSRPLREAAETLSVFAVVHGWLLYLLLSRPDAFWAVARGWWLPARAAMCFLGYSFDYVPHRPHAATREADPYATTARVVGLTNVKQQVPLTWPLLFQDYHVIHHLYPFIPFFRYAAVWWRHRGELMALGVREASVYCASTPWW